MHLCLDHKANKRLSTRREIYEKVRGMCVVRVCAGEMEGDVCM